MTCAVPFVCLLAAGLTGCSSEHKSKESQAGTPTPAAAQQPLTVERSINSSVTARVKAIDQAARLVTLQDSSGHEETFYVDPSVTRLNEVNVGDSVRATYRATLVAELRPPTADEAAHPLVVVESGGRSPSGAAPAASATQTVRAVTTVEAVDVPNMLVTLRGPLGDTAVVRGRNPDNVRRLRVGDTVVITYTGASVLSLQKAGS
jgi:hypothetical protein